MRAYQASPARYPTSASRALDELQQRTRLFDPVEDIACYGRWWLDPASSQMLLSDVASGFFRLQANHLKLDDLLVRLMSEDALRLDSALKQHRASGRDIDCEVRVIDEENGLRWLRMVSLPPDPASPGIQRGLLRDMTAARHSAMRERLGYESTRFLVGTNTLADAVTKVIRLVCETLGWEWGAYWALEQEEHGGPRLRCKYFWHKPGDPLESFTASSNALRMAPGEGLIGDVWKSGQAAWVDDVATEHGFLRRDSAVECGLHSAFAFPVAFSADGRRHSPGVLEFFSSVARQREALLPSVSASIGALIAQTVRRLEQDEAVRRMTETDDLTGLANRKHFYQTLADACSGGSSAPFGVLYIDLDRFKPINDTYGHEAGNHVLQEFSRRLERLAPPECMVGRLGGDEFALLLSPSLPAERIGMVADLVLQAARLPFLFGGTEMSVSASVGVSLFPDNGRSGPELLRSADAAMYRSKQVGRGRLSFSAPARPGPDDLPGMPDMLQGPHSPNSPAVRTRSLESELHGALDRGEFVLEYQPVYDLYTEKVAAVEALVRWRHPVIGLLQPDAFIPLAEQSGLVARIGRWVVTQACADLVRLHLAGYADLRMSVNMAADEFINAYLPQDLAAITAAAGIAPHHLCLELTETMVMDYPEKVIPIMTALRQLGFRISLDDFGIGHSSLSRMKQLPISSLKIDRSFMRGLPNDLDSAIVRTILDLGRHMKLQVIAEGVETDAQLVFLRQFGCQFAQGFVLSRPVPIERLLTDTLVQPGLRAA